MNHHWASIVWMLMVESPDETQQRCCKFRNTMIRPGSKVILCNCFSCFALPQYRITNQKLNTLMTLEVYHSHVKFSNFIICKGICFQVVYCKATIVHYVANLLGPILMALNLSKYTITQEINNFVISPALAFSTK